MIEETTAPPQVVTKVPPTMYLDYADVDYGRYVDSETANYLREHLNAIIHNTIYWGFRQMLFFHL